MIRTVVIHPLMGNVNIRLDGCYTYQGKIIRLSLDKKKTFSAEKPGDKRFNIDFGQQLRQYRFTFDPDNHNGEGYDLWEFYKTHPNVRIKGEKHPNQSATPMFEMEDVTKSSERNAKDLEDKFKVMEILLNAYHSDHEYLKNIGFRYGINPLSRTLSELFNELGDYTKGALMHINHDALPEPINMPKKFLEDDENSPDKDFIVNTQKSIAYGLMTKVGGFYMILGEQVGADFKDALNFCKSNKKTYEGYIIPKIEEIEGKNKPEGKARKPRTDKLTID